MTTLKNLFKTENYSLNCFKGIEDDEFIQNEISKIVSKYDKNSKISETDQSLLDMLYLIRAYINSGKNGDFKNYRIKDDLLNYNIEERTIKINKLQTSSENLIINYYMRIIQGDDYIKGENLKSISLIESNSSFLTTTNIDDNSVTYDVKKEINRYKNYKTNCYITIIENYSDIELIAYSYSSLEPINANKPSVGLATASLSITGFAFVCFVVRLTHHCTCAENY